MGEVHPYKVAGEYQSTLGRLKCQQVPIKILAFKILYQKGFLKFKITVSYI